ncbi:hypothetical protein K461DRAFT_291866 [Myriangium duriaei CBS 260.36]|uniref:Uncharacterized protein n=1 Tax=Myriangium duriaei CBS 260.36 TaxID=1168546 RepID=A0A9P4J9X5_9PEZI|nr:hypothetical protein K461DRAFT_291866 [Myriangium duriaei CBS 260.36]
MSDNDRFAWLDSSSARKLLKNPFIIAVSRRRAHSDPPISQPVPAHQRTPTSISFPEINFADDETTRKTARGPLPAVTRHLEQVRFDVLALKDLCIRFTATFRDASVLLKASERTRQALRIIFNLSKTIVDETSTAIYNHIHPRWRHSSNSSAQPLQCSLWHTLVRSQSHVDVCTLRRAVSMHRTTLDLMLHMFRKYQALTSIPEVCDSDFLGRLETMSNSIAPLLAALHVDSGEALYDTLDRMDRQIALLEDTVIQPAALATAADLDPVICASPISYSPPTSPITTTRQAHSLTQSSSVYSTHPYSTPTSTSTSTSPISAPAAPTTPIAPAFVLPPPLPSSAGAASTTTKTPSPAPPSHIATPNAPTTPTAPAFILPPHSSRSASNPLSRSQPQSSSLANSRSHCQASTTPTTPNYLGAFTFEPPTPPRTGSTATTSPPRNESRPRQPTVPTPPPSPTPGARQPLLHTKSQLAPPLPARDPRRNSERIAVVDFAARSELEGHSRRSSTETRAALHPTTTTRHGRTPSAESSGTGYSSAEGHSRRTSTESSERGQKHGLVRRAEVVKRKPANASGHGHGHGHGRGHRHRSNRGVGNGRVGVPVR